MSAGATSVNLPQFTKTSISSCDSGPLRPMADEVARGWTSQGIVAISPPLIDGLPIPNDQYDEWYLVDNATFDKCEIEVFVNCGRFTLVAPADIYKTFDPTWEKRGLDYLAPIQERFWLQMQQLKPETYVAMGDNEVIVSRNQQFIEAVNEATEAQEKGNRRTS